MNILKTLKSRFVSALAHLTDDAATYADMIKPTQDAKFGDYQANCAMPLAKQQGTNPRELAARILEKLDVSDLCQTPEVAGPGFINLTLLPTLVQSEANQSFQNARLGVDEVDPPKTVIVDFSSPNVAKPMHVGHLRSTVIGDSLARVHRFLGHRVITDNHLGDWGTQFGMIIYGYKNFVDAAAYQKDAVTELARMYRLVNQLSDYHDALKQLPVARTNLETATQTLKQLKASEADKDPAQKKRLKKQQSDVNSARAEIESLEKKIAAIDSQSDLKQLADQHPDVARLAREETSKLHAGDEENLQLWKEFLPACLEALQKLYDRLGVKFDLVYGESYYNDALPGIVSDFQQKGLSQESDGAICVFLDGHQAPFIIRKADGAFTYATTDLATIRYRVEELKADSVLYVVDNRQSEHFQMLFQTADQWGYGSQEFRHVSFGTVMGKDGRPYKTRSGDTVGLESLLDEAIEKATEIVSANDDSKTDAEGNPRPELDQGLRNRIGEMVGVGGIKYADLRHHRESDYIFDYDKMLAKNGDTATYIQYAHARVYGIFRKGNITPESIAVQESPIQLEHPAERKLALQLLRYSEALDAVASELRPNVLTQYLFDLANDLTSFYDQCPVLKAEDKSIQTSRLALCLYAAKVLSHGMNLLGIETPHQM